VDFEPGQLCFLTDDFFKKVNDPKLSAGFKGSTRPFYIAHKDENNALLWVAPCSTQCDKYENLITKRELDGKSSEGIQIENIFGAKSTILLQDIFPVTANSIKKPYIKHGIVAGLTSPARVSKYEQISRRIEKRFRHNKSPVTYRPDALRIEKIMLEEEREMNEKKPLPTREAEQNDEITSGESSANKFSVYETNNGNLSLFVQDRTNDSVNFAHDYKDAPGEILPAIQAVQGGDDAKTWDGHDQSLAAAFGNLPADNILVASDAGVYPDMMRETAREAFGLTLEDFLAFEKYTKSPPEGVDFDKLQELSQKFANLNHNEYWEIADELSHQAMGVTWEDYYAFAAHMESPEMESFRVQSAMQELNELSTLSQIETKLPTARDESARESENFSRAEDFTKAAGEPYGDALDAPGPALTAENLGITAEMPDPAIGIAEMNAHGYTWDGMLPLTQEKALELFDKDLPVYILRSDNSETLAEYRDEIETHAGIFGIETENWEAALDFEAMKAQNEAIFNAIMQQEKSEDAAEVPALLTSSQFETKLPLEQNLAVKELFDTLYFSGNREQAAALQDLVNYTKDAEKTIRDCTGAISEMKSQLSSAKEIQDNPIKTYLTNCIKRLENSVKALHIDCDNIKKDIIASCNSTLEAAKERGIGVLGAMSEHFQLREQCEKIAARAQNSVERCEKTITRIEAFSKEYHKAENALKNIGRMLTGKPAVDKEAEAGKLAQTLCAPYRTHIKRSTQICNHANEAVAAIDKLRQSAEEHSKNRTASPQTHNQESFADKKARMEAKAKQQINDKPKPERDKPNRDESL